MLEPNIYGLWVGKQTAKGTPNATPSKRLVQVGGDLTTGRDDGTEEYSDLTKYGAATDWVNSATGGGDPVIEATPTELAYLLWLFHGAETVTAIPGPPAASKHSYKPQAGRGFYSTWVRRVGQSIVQRHAYNDCLIGRIQIDGGTGQKPIHVTPHVLSLDPAQVKTSDPAAALPTDKPFLYTDGVSVAGAGTFTIDGTVVRGASAFTFVADEDLSLVYGDGITPVDVVQGNANATISVTLYFDADGLAEWNKLIYGTATPALDTKPLTTVPALGSYSFDLVQRTAGTNTANGRRLNLNVPGVKWAVPNAPGPAPAGGATEVTLAGTIRPTAPAADPYTIDVYTNAADVAFTV